MKFLPLKTTPSICLVEEELQILHTILLILFSSLVIVSELCTLMVNLEKISSWLCCKSKCKYKKMSKLKVKGKMYS